MSASHTFPQLHLLTPVFARDAAGERQLVRLGHYLIPHDGFVMAAAVLSPPGTLFAERAAGPARA